MEDEVAGRNYGGAGVFREDTWGDGVAAKAVAAHFSSGEAERAGTVSGVADDRA